MCFEEEIAIKVSGLTKIYRLYERPIDRLKELFLKRPFHREFVALKEISFECPQGIALGIIGDNGAGKSTLLKILSKTLAPTSGTFVVKGNVASLLELGTGFHPDFTGRENIFFYGTLLGIDKEKIEKHVDEIVDFSGLGQFIDYPIRTYSSGMYVRLAFSVATILDPDILIIDEALSVGDQIFQKKCLDKMRQFKEQHKTMLFCTHDMYQITSFCDSVIWLHRGEVMLEGPPDYVVKQYREFQNDERNEGNMPIDGGSSNFLYIKGLEAELDREKNLIIRFEVENTLDSVFRGHVGWAIFTSCGLQMAFDTSKKLGLSPFEFGEIPRTVELVVESPNLVEGTYLIYAGVFDEEAFRPLVIDSIRTYLGTGLYSLNSVCFFKSRARVS